ncbi:MAG TPA: Uma2 family endonuclease, partial [Bryobacteraceae bacterium]
SEFYRGEMFAIAGGSRRHNELCGRLIGILFGRLRGSGCKVYPSDMKVQTGPDGLYTYPDVAVVCGDPICADGGDEILVNPKVIFEVLSKSTEVNKFQQYKQIESLEEYVLVSQTEPLIERFGRRPGAPWAAYSEARGLDVQLQLDSLGVEIPLSEIYQDVVFEIDA